MGSASSLKSRKEGIVISEPLPSSAMMGSVSSQMSSLSWPSSPKHASCEHKHMSSAIKTAAAPARWALRTFLTKVQSPRSTMRIKGAFQGELSERWGYPPVVSTVDSQRVDAA